MPNLSISPFDLAQTSVYLHWREQKLASYPKSLDSLIVEVADPGNLLEHEYTELLEVCQHANMVIYAGPADKARDKASVHRLGLRFGLSRLDHNPGADEDAITAITVQNDSNHRDYIPYTNKDIAWHTDGYYNTSARQIHGMILHCVQPALEGGYNFLLDHEIAYIALRDHNPDYIRALMHPEAMLIPPNVVNGVQVRPASHGPVFRILPDGALHMRYTDRTRSIIWQDDTTTQAAVEFLKAWLHAPNPWGFRVKLAAGQGVITNNTLHTRSTFTDGPIPRLLYRARYYDRIQGMHTWI